MYKLTTITFIALILVGCYKTEYSGTMSENGKVIDCFYSPAQITHTSTQTVSIGNDLNSNAYSSYNSN